ncbi:hypothetical protein LAZ67_15000949 [Cordylochernes scorpioides]|uniref:Reverse transcriptase domain-containing protein n=1 Tax=Cordylochernes scorpioides TaxID=51811 RepID=A0ABY6LAX7_9ARAC|nr:hypothetical protein LAZ67_15000949 [Cordylochernes scorpioides]
MEFSNSYQVLAESQEDGEDDGVTPIQELATNTERSAEEHLALSTARKTTSGDAPSGSAQGQPRVTGASSSAGAVVTADASANRAQNGYVNSSTKNGSDANRAAETIDKNVNWADQVEAADKDEDPTPFIQVKKRKASPPKSQPTKVAKSESSAPKPAGNTRVFNRNPVAAIKNTRQQQQINKARSAAASFDQGCFIEWCPDFDHLCYMRALEEKLGRGSVFQLMRMSGHMLASLSSVEKAERLIEDGLTIGDTILRAFPYRKRAEKIIIGNLPIAVKEEDIVATLRPYCRVVSLAIEIVNCEGYSWATGNREAFILMNDGMKLHQLPGKVDIKSKGETTPAFITHGVKCSMCHRQGHRRASCPKRDREERPTIQQTPRQDPARLPPTTQTPSSAALAVTPPAALGRPQASRTSSVESYIKSSPNPSFAGLFQNHRGGISSASSPKRTTYAVPGRCPSWNIACRSDEVAQAFKNKTPLAVISTDLQSAFDNVDREFLASQLRIIGLPPPFMEWLHLLYAEADATIKVDGNFTRPFKMRRGLRQGCACSAALFSIFTGPLLRHLERILGRGNVLAYADDILLLIREDWQFERVKTIFDEFRRASGVSVNFPKSKGLWCGSWRDRADSPLGISWSASSITVLGCEITSGHGTSVQENHLLGILERSISRWSPFVRGFSLVGRARAANSLVLAAVLHHLHGYLPGEATIAKLQARLTRFVWGSCHRAAWLPGGLLARPVSVGGVGLLDIRTQLQLACLKGVQAASRNGGKNAYSWLVESGAWMTPLSSGSWLLPRRRRLLDLWGQASFILGLNHRVLPAPTLLNLPLVGACRLRDDRIFISKDYSPKIRDQRRILNAKRKELPERGTKAKLRDNRLLVNGVSYQVKNGQVSIPNILRVICKFELQICSFARKQGLKRSRWEVISADLINPDDQVIKAEIKGLADVKAAGPDNIPNEHFKKLPIPILEK